MQSKFLFLLQVDHFGLIIIFWALHMFELFLLTILSGCGSYMPLSSMVVFF